ncbi:hypothetical protein GO491_06045 [Flavobacteriaceae bacterium Ap0902]|nr:hypothetical protein [Flavobacteriaceae bacterium Ap0902]
MENRTVKERRLLVDKVEKLNVRKQSKLLEINRSSLYYSPKTERFENLEIMRKIDHIYLDNPTYGVWLRTYVPQAHLI